MNGSFELLFVVVLALLTGSVLNMIIHRLPIMLEFKPQNHQMFNTYNLFLPRSHCPHCAVTIPWYHNIPILSYFILKGRCVHCQTKISLRYPLIESLYLALVLALYWVLPNPTKLIAASWFTALLLIQAIIDLELLLLPDVLNYLLLWTGLFINSFGVFCRLHEAVYGSLFAYLSIWIFYHLFVKLTGKQGFGYGDFKLYAAIGAWIGVHKIFECMMLSCLIGIFFGSIWLWKHKSDKKAIFPFGPALAIAGYLLILLNDIPFIHRLEF